MVDTGLADDDDEFESFIAELYDRLRRSAARMVDAGYLAQDMVQEACFNLLRHYQSRKELGMDPMLGPGLAFTVLRNAIASHFRKEAAEKRRMESVEVFTAAATVAHDPGTLVSEDDAKKRFFESLGPEQQKIALLLEAGFTPAEIGDILGKAEGTVRNHVTVIRRTYKRFFGY